MEVQQTVDVAQEEVFVRPGETAEFWQQQEYGAHPNDLNEKVLAHQDSLDTARTISHDKEQHRKINLEELYDYFYSPNAPDDRYD